MPETFKNVHWRRIWQITSGNLKNASPAHVKQNLEQYRDELLKGISCFKTVDTPVDAEEQAKWNEDVFRFVHRAAKKLNTDKSTAWTILKSFFMNEYCGSIRTIKRLRYEMHIQPMLDKVLRYYASERMFMIKTLKSALEFGTDSNHPYNEIYKEFISSTGHNRIWQALLNQWKYILSEIKIRTQDDRALLKNWKERNTRELIEVLHCLIILTHLQKFTLQDFHEVLSLCKINGFGRDSTVGDIAVPIDADLMNKLIYSEVALLLCVGNRLWTTNPDDWYMEDSTITLELDSIAYREEHGALCYVWVIIHMVLKNREELFENGFQAILARAMKLQAMHFFSKMISHEIFNNAKGVTEASVQEALFNMLALGCKYFDDNGQMLMADGVAEVLQLLLKNTYLAKRFFNEFKSSEDHISIWSTACEIFPYKFEYLTNFVASVIESRAVELPKIIELMSHLAWYSQKYDEESELLNQTYMPETSDTTTLTNDFQLRNTGGYVVRGNSQIFVRQWTGDILITFSVDLSYWVIFHEYINTILGPCTGDEIYINHVICGYQVLQAILKVDRDAIQRYPVLANVTSSIFTILNKYCTIEIAHYRLIVACIDVLSAMMYKNSEIVAKHLESINILPQILKDDFTYDEMYRTNFLEMGKIGVLILQKGHHPDQHILLISYIKFIRSAFLVDKNLNQIELPGLVFVLKEIIPHFMTWDNIRHEIYSDVLYQCLHFVFEILQCSAEKLEIPKYEHLYRLTYQCFLNESCGRCLLRIVFLSNSGVQTIMENETNWQSGRGIQYISVIKKAMAILMQILMQRKLIVGENIMTPLEHLIYLEDNSRRTVHSIASFMNHAYNDSIPNLACRLLKKFTVELQMSMLAALDLEPVQIRLMFIHRLRDPLENDELKLAVIELVTACVPKQPGMTEAFFNVKKTRNRLSDTILGPLEPNPPSELSFNEGIGNFLVEYLHKFSEERSAVFSYKPLVTRIMELLNVLWMNQKEMLIADITSDAYFWSAFSCPLFNEITFCDRTYSKMINIFAKEIHKKSGQIDESLINVLQKLFSLENNYINIWLHHILVLDKSPESIIPSDEPNQTDYLMLAWKDFLIISINFLPSLFTKQLRMILIEKCRATLRDHSASLNNIALTFIAELYLFLINKWGDIAFTENGVFYDDINIIMQFVAKNYSTLSARFKDSILSIAVLSIQGTKILQSIDTEVTTSLVQSIGTVFNAEYESFVVKYNKKEFEKMIYQKERYKSFLLCFEALNQLILIQNQINSPYNQWIANENILYKFICCVKLFMENESTLSMTKVAIEILILYAYSANTSDFLKSDISMVLWDKLLPKTKYRFPSQLGRIEPFPWDLKEWWIIYKRSIILLLKLLQLHGHAFIKEVLMFISLHEDYLTNILLLERYTVDSNVLNLISMLLIFLREVFLYEKVWREDHEKPMLHIFNTIKTTLSNCSAILVRPTVLKYYTPTSIYYVDDNINFESISPDLLITVANELLDIVKYATMCINLFTPPLYPMCRDKIKDNWPLLVGVDFVVPEFGVQEVTQVTFGSLICCAGLFVRTLTQIKVPLSPREILKARKNKPKQDDVRSSTELEPENDKSSLAQIRKMAGKYTSDKPVQGYMRVEYLNLIRGLTVVESLVNYAGPITIYPWFFKLNENKLTDALETILTLLASQVHIVLNYYTLDQRDEKMIKRELNSELQIFHEFVKKRISDIYRYSRNNFSRRICGIVEDEEPDGLKHITNKRTLGAKPSFASPSARAPCRPSLFEVKLSPEDYLHFLSLWFTYVLYNSNGSK